LGLFDRIILTKTPQICGVSSSWIRGVVSTFLTTLEIFNPLDQFVITPQKRCFTNNVVNVMIGHFLVIIWISQLINFSIYTNNIMGWVIESMVFVARDSYLKNANLKTPIFFPIYMFIFLTVLVYNFCGLIPYSYAVTSSFVFNFFLVLSLFIGLNLIGIIYHKWNFLNIFMPKGLPLVFSWFLIFFETVSYFARILSLTIRLFANILSGHILQHILISFAFKIFMLGNWYSILFIFPWLITFVVTFLEIGIAFLQAYVFFILWLLYINNAMNLH